MSKSTIRRLASLECFASCRRSELEAIDRLGVTLDVPAGRVLCVEGQPGDECFGASGGGAACRPAAGGGAVVFPGGWCGEAALRDRAPGRAAVAALRAATFRVLNHGGGRTFCPQ